MALSSKKLYFRYNATNYDLPLFSEKETSCTLSIREGNETLYALADRPEIENIDYTENNIRYFYNSDKPTIHYWQDGYRRNCFNDSEQAITYDIPAGTYTPSAFYDLITAYISANGNRQTKYEIGLMIGGKTNFIPANSNIYRRVFYPGLGSMNASIVGFNVDPNTKDYSGQISWKQNSGQCCYCMKAFNTYGRLYSGYENWNITIFSPGIKFV